jgi:hypothetical protein
VRSLNLQADEKMHSRLNEIHAELKQMHKIVEDGQHIATIGVNAAADINAALERVTGLDHDGDGTVRQQLMRECRSWYYFFPCVDTRRG